MATIHDVAKRAEVSISTVSRVVNRSVPVDPVTEARVREAIAALGYRPNLLARSFRSRVTHTIGLVVPDNSNPFFAELARVIEDEGFAAGYSVVLCNSDLSEIKQSVYVDALLAKRVDGLIIVSSGLIPSESGADVMGSILNARAPCVAIDRDLGDMRVDQVLVDNVQGGNLAARYLVERGHRRIAYVSGPTERTPSAGRFAGFRGGLAEFGLDITPELVLSGNGRHDGGVHAAQQLLNLTQRVGITAAFAFNDLTAIGLAGALYRAGFRVPEELSIVGFDDIPQAATSIPALTTIAQPIAEMGRLSVRLLLDRIARPDAPHQRVVLPTELVERESCKAPATHSTGGD